MLLEAAEEWLFARGWKTIWLQTGEEERNRSHGFYRASGWAMTGPAGYNFVLGYGGNLSAPTLDFVAGEKNIIGNIVGTYNDLAELMVLAQAGKVTLHTVQYPLDRALDALRDLDAGKVRGRAILVP